MEKKLKRKKKKKAERRRIKRDSCIGGI